jgi:16S rRNA (cytosine1402-N4)-methyltransferase
MLHEAVDGLAPERGGWLIDCTFGRGGHARAILERLGRRGRLIALDKDPSALASEEAKALESDDRFELVHASFTQLRAIANERGWAGQVSGILMDLGVSSPQLDDAERGFSFTRNGPLDMRMDPTAGSTAAEWLAGIGESELAQVLRDYGEERYARRIARTIVGRRSDRPFLTTGDLAETIIKAVPTREPGKHPATRTFQAIRICVNHELDELNSGLEQAVDMLGTGGRLAVISFHSLEDRMVKRRIRDEAQGGEPPPRGVPWHSPDERLPRLARLGKAIKPSTEEIRENPRARSAVLRLAERLPT